MTRRSATLAVAVLAAGGQLVGSTVSSYAASSVRAAYCPAATTSAATNFVWTQRPIAAGVTLLSTTINASRGTVGVKVLSIDLTQPGVGIAPLYEDLASVHDLTSLADRSPIVAATNAMYFSLTYGAPVVAFIAGGQPMVLTSTPRRVAGIGVDQRAEDGMVWLAGSVRSDDAVMQLVAVNDAAPPVGLSILTPAWGPHPVALPSDARSRTVSQGRIAGPIGRTRIPPAGGSLLIARGDEAVQWLRALAHNAPVAISSTVDTNAAVPFAQAYGTGTQVVSQADQPRTHVICANPVLAARTAIAWTRSRTTLLLVTAESPRGPDGFGLDWNQMSALLTQLRSAMGYTLDGGTSTEMVAKLPGHEHLALETAPHGNRQRPIPVGIGVIAP